MSHAPIAVAIEPGPAAYCALRFAADLAARLGCPLRGHALVPGGTPALRALRRLRLAGRRRGVDVSFVHPATTDLGAFAAAAHGARLLVVGRAPGKGSPRFGRRAALARLLRASGPPVLVVPRRGRPLGERVLLACASAPSETVDALYDLVAPLVVRVSVLRYLERDRAIPADPGLDALLGRATAWDERHVHSDDEVGELGDTILRVADRLHPTLVVVTRAAEGPALAALFAPESADRVVCDSPWPALVARTPAAVSPATPARAA